MGSVVSKKLFTFPGGLCSVRRAPPPTKYIFEDVDEIKKQAAGKAAAAGTPAAWTPAAGTPVAGTPVARVGAVENLPWLFPDPAGPGHASTFFMNVFGNNVTCAACGNSPTDYRGTLFKCCEKVACSRCTVKACLGPAERLKLDLHKHLSASGRVLENVVCPACKKREHVGFPVNGNYGRVYADAAPGAP